MIALPIIAVLVLIFAGVGIPFSFLGGAMLWSLLEGGSLGSFASTSYYSLDAYSLLALPLFMSAGILLDKSGIAKQLVNLAEMLLRKVKGGLGATIPVVSAFYGALSGSGLACLTTVGTMLGPRLEEKGWDKNYIAALTVAASPLGYMIPPNMNAIVFTKVSDASVGAMFLATVIPGIIWTLGYCVLNRLIYHKYYNPANAVATANTSAEEESYKDTWMYKWSVIRSAIPAFVMPVIILGGIYGGVFTATEAGGVGCLYAIIVGVFVYGGLRNRKKIFEVFYESGYSVATILMIFPMTLIFSRQLVMHGVPEMMTKMLMGISTNPYIIMLLIDILLFIAGFFLDCNVLLLVLTPLLLPTANAIGLSQIHLATMIFVAIGLGNMTPPMATGLYMSVRICNADLIKTCKALCYPLFLVGVPMLLLVTYVPWMSEWLPSLLMK